MAHDPLIRALAAVAESAVQNTQRQARYAIDHGEAMYERCACDVDVDLKRCDCRVELAPGKAWMRRAAERLARNEFVGMPPRRRCRLCRAGEHDLVETHEVNMQVAGQAGAWTTRMISPVRRSRKQEVDRAARAGCYPAGSAEAQREAAGIGN